MASQFQAQEPYVLTSLPRPLDPATGTYVVGEVFGYAPGSRKRKRRRAELTVGIDGEAINIYDVSSSRLVTSYPIPPQSRLSCPASSIRLRTASTKDVSRYTYGALYETGAHKVTLCKDTVSESGQTNQTSCSIALADGQPAVWLAPVSSHSPAQGEASEPNSASELLVVRGGGEIVCLDGESLKQKWTSTALAMLQDLADDAKSNFTIDFCRSVSASDVAKGIFKGDSDVFRVLSAAGQGLDEDAEVFVLVSSSGMSGQRSRHLHVVGRLPMISTSTESNQGIIQLHVMPLMAPSGKQSRPRSYRLDARNGTLLELHHHNILIHDLTASIPKITSTTQLDGTTSFLPLSKTSLLCSTDTQLSVFNPVYKSLQNTIDIDLATQGRTDAERNKGSTSCQLVAYFSPLERAIAIVGFNLVAIQLEAPKTRHAKRRAEGLLIDSIGRGVPAEKRRAQPPSRQPPEKSVFSNYLPGSVRGDYWKQWTNDQKQADSLFNSNDIPQFETFLASKFGIPIETTSVPSEDSTDTTTKDTLVWRLPRSRANYPTVDRRWVLYAISRSFQWNNALPDDSTVPRLIFQLPQSNVLNYLVDAGHLTLSNIRTAFRSTLVEKEASDSFLAGELVTRLSEIDSSLELLVIYLSATNLGALEVLLVLKAIMKSLELVNDTKEPPPKLLTNGTTDNATDDDDTTDNDNIGMELDDLEDEIQKTVSYLNNENAGIRGTGLSVAFAKLGACPPVSAVKTLRATLKPQEIMSLIYILRIELVKGGWTDRYLETDHRDDDAPFDAPPDGIIKLIADLIGLCLDSLGPGGWMLHDTLQGGNDTIDFVGSLTHEVSAALEGLEEVVYMRNFLAGPVKYCEAVAKRAAGAVTAQDKPSTVKPITTHANEAVAASLPLSLKPASQGISKHKVISGGEVVERTARETGYLISQKVGPYSLERIII
ncbi:hypothetical protein F4777DRAFT_555162 [Nemania sp. FL0916]|nr:hypothetical protein F4777DRAFT_555162 [Nemania sp. FL0916]